MGLLGIKILEEKLGSTGARWGDGREVFMKSEANTTLRKRLKKTVFSARKLGLRQGWRQNQASVFVSKAMDICMGGRP